MSSSPVSVAPSAVPDGRESKHADWHWVAGVTGRKRPRAPDVEANVAETTGADPPRPKRMVIAVSTPPPALASTLTALARPGLSGEDKHAPPPTPDNSGPSTPSVIRVTNEETIVVPPGSAWTVPAIDALSKTPLATLTVGRLVSPSSAADEQELSDHLKTLADRIRLLAAREHERCARHVRRLDCLAARRMLIRRLFYMASNVMSADPRVEATVRICHRFGLRLHHKRFPAEFCSYEYVKGVVCILRMLATDQVWATACTHARVNSGCVHLTTLCPEGQACRFDDRDPDLPA